MTQADVDNHPLGWATSGVKGPEDIDRNGNTVFDTGDALQIVWSDSWDDFAEEFPTLGAIQTDPPVIQGKPIIGCDNYSTWNQVRPGVFDGGYAFNDIPAGQYIVQTFPPPGYLIQTEESINVGFGDVFKPSPLLLPPECVGTTNNGEPLHIVPQYLTLFPEAMEPAPFAGEERPLATMKWVSLGNGQNAAADFHMYTEVPKAGRVCGFVLNDLGAEFNMASPNYGEKLAAPWLPIAVRDWAGTEIQRIYSDEYGSYNALIPSTYTVNAPTPNGMSENMLTFVLNDPLLPDGTIDPFYNPMYATAPWTFNFSPGGITYLDTPIVPIAAFSTAEVRIDTEPPDGEPVIREVNGPEPMGGPWISATRTTGRQVSITAMGMTSVINPDYNSSIPGSQMNILRDYGFGPAAGSVELAGIPLSIVSWTTNQIVATVPQGIPSGDLLVTRSNGRRTQIGVTFHSIDPASTAVHHVGPGAFTNIQSAIDSPTVTAGDLVLVQPGVYNENVIMNKPIKLQGYGAGSTIIYGNPTPLQRLQSWHDRVNALGAADLAAFMLKDPFQANEAPVVLIAGELAYPAGTIQIPQEGTKTFNPGNPFTTPSQLDGFSLLGSKAGGGVFVVVGAPDVKISNNNIYGNQGGDAGAITIGTEDVGFDSGNYRNLIHRNRCHRNSGIAGAGAISVNEASDNYIVEDNYIIGNFTRANGAGFKHLGLSGGTNIVRRNTILFNENMYQALFFLQGNGGGMYIAGDVAGGTGAGNVVVDGNLIQGNMVGAGKGGGICVFAFNGQDAISAPTDTNAWWELKIVNNIIVNNIASHTAGGISLEDAVRTTIAHNTIANNDCTATSALLFNPGESNSPPQVAGVAVFPMSPTLRAALGVPYASPSILYNIIWHNRSFFFDPALNAGAGGLAANPAGLYQDLGLVGATGPLTTSYNLLTSTSGFGGANNISGNPQFLQPYTNLIETATVIDEGGNNINLRFLPISITGNYHIASGSPARNSIPAGYLANNPALRSDFDGHWRPFGSTADRGADEYFIEYYTAQNDFYSVIENGSLTVPFPGIKANDTGLGTIYVLLTSGPRHGSLSLNSNGSFSYQPEAGFSGLDSFTYRSRNFSGTMVSKEAQVFITVNPLNDRPIATPDSYAVNDGAVFNLPAPGVLGNDLDPDGDSLTAVQVSGPSNGVLSLNADGSFMYTADPGFSGVDSFRYRADDGRLLSLPETGAEVTLNVSPAQPDFVVTSIIVDPQPVTTGAVMTVSVVVQNAGTAAGEPGLLSVWRDLSGPDVPAGAVGDDSATLGLLNAGSSTTIVFAMTAPDLPAAIENQSPPVVFRAFVNSASPQLPEFDLANNQRTRLYAVVKYEAAFLPLPMDDDMMDSDGDGDPMNDYVYGHLAAGDGFAKMADGNELYTFGFSDHTAMAMMMMRSHPDKVLSMVTMEGMLKAECSSPTIVLREGQKFFLDLSNVGMVRRPDLFDPHTLHFHGFPQAAVIFDGEPMGSVSINMGATYRYFYNIVEPGTFFYHCHVEATEHMEMGMIGNLWVRPKQNYLPDGYPFANGFVHRTGYQYVYNDGDGSTRYDVELPMQMGGFDRDFHEKHINTQPLPFWSLDTSYPLLNGRGYPDTLNTNPIYNAEGDYFGQKVISTVRATVGQKVLLRISNASVSDFHTLTVLGLPMTVVGKDARLLRSASGSNIYYRTTSVTLGGGETTDAILDTEGAAPGSYFIYDARLNHLSNDQEDYGGMMTEIIVE